MLDQQHPPVGRLQHLHDETTATGGWTGRSGVEFVGWLGLLRALYDLIEPDGKQPDSSTRP